MNEDCTYALTVRALQQLPQHLLGVVFGAAAPSPENSFLQPSGLVGPGHLMSMLTRRHMHLYGTQPAALQEIVQATRDNPRNRPKAVRRNGLSDEENWGPPLLAAPLRPLHLCLETDVAVALVPTPPDHAT